MASAPRPQHEFFSHSLLPKLFFANPEGLFDLLDSGGNSYLAYLWERAGELAEPSESRIPARLELDSVKIHPRSRLQIISLPEPICPGEALYLGVVYRPARIRLTGIEPQLARYYSQEIARTSEMRSAEWTLAEWSHEAGPPSLNPAGLTRDKASFVESVSALLGL